MNRFLLLPVVGIFVFGILGSSVVAAPKKIKCYPIEITGTSNRPWTVLASREDVLSTPSWTDPTASEPPLLPETAIRLGEEFIRAKGFENHASFIRITACDIFSPEKWYYVISFGGDRDQRLNKIGCDSVVVLMNGAVIEPIEGRHSPVYEK